MNCVYCDAETKVVDKRDTGTITRRRRECLKCKKRFTTYEEVFLGELFVIKKDGRREPFNKEKLKIGIIKSCEKRPVSVEKIDMVVEEIVEKLRKKGKEVKSKLIGDVVIKALKKLDKVAYIRFASVYHEFDTLSDFRKEIKEID